MKTKTNNNNKVNKPVAVNVGRKNSFMDKVKNNWQLLVLLIPFVLFYVFFMYKPMLGLQIAFKDYSLFKGISGSDWVGLEHFRNFLSSKYFLRTFKNTIIINMYGLIFGFPVPILLALMLNEVKNMKFKKTIQTMTYLPHFISIVVIAGIVINFLAPSNGLVNIIRAKFGAEKIYFLTKPEYFRAIYTTMNIWKESGFGAVVYLAALAGVDVQLYEAAYIDGATKLKRIWHVTIPCILPTISIMLIMKIGNMVKLGYEAILLLYQPVTYETADVISTYVYRLGLQDTQFDLATAVGLFNAIISLVLVWGANRFSKKFSETSLW